MNIKDKAKKYAEIYHGNQIRKSNGKLMIYHPIAVAELLEYYGYDDEIIAAGYLHDTIEDTETTIEKIKKDFGSKVASLVNFSSEPDKSLSWEERKQHTIKNVINYSHYSIDDIVVILADKIHNIEDLTNELKIQGFYVFNSFKRGYENMLWYFESIYNAISHYELPIVKRLGEALTNLKNEIEYQTQLEKRLDTDIAILKKDINSK